MGGSKIKAKIWLSVGIFAAGFLLSIVVSQLARVRAERELETINRTILPAERGVCEAHYAFRRAMRLYGGAVTTGDWSGIDHAAAEGRAVIESLDAVDALAGVSSARLASTRSIRAAASRFLSGAGILTGITAAQRDTWGARPIDHLTALAPEKDRIESTLAALDQGFSADLLERMEYLRASSVRMRVLMPALFCATLLLATVLVHLTIKHSILRPLARTHAELEHERDLLRILMDYVPDRIYFKDAQSRFVRINKAQAAALGIAEPEEACGRSDRDYFDDEFAQTAYEDEQRILRTGECIVSSMERVCRQGVESWVTATKVPVLDRENGEHLLVGISRDVTEWHEAVGAIERSEASFRLLFSAIPHAVWVCEVDTLRILEVNDAAVRQYGYTADEFRGMSIGDIFPAHDRDCLTRALATLDSSQPARRPQQHIAKDGRVIDVELENRLLLLHGHRALMIMAQDVSERKHLELELHQAQRLEAVGQLAAGIAHEINTPIQFVGDNLRFLHDAFQQRQVVVKKYRQLHSAARAGDIPTGLLDELDAAIEATDAEYLTCEIPKATDQALEGVDRVATIVSAMKAFAHPGQKEKAAADINKALANALIVARNEFKYVADVVTDYGDLPPVMCHIGDLNQVFLNLLVNASHAIGTVVKQEGGKGLITIRTAIEGDQVVISMADTGCGIPAAIQARVFDPFFTTKEVGRGTGQGLALARAVVVEKHGGRIVFEPNVPRGTTFFVYLPLEQPGGAVESGDGFSIPAGVL
jgi:two-component system, NtrC family, sensor kinase